MAARGIVHAEYREHEFARRDGTLHGARLWVNLPARDKMNPPGYQDLSAPRIAEVTQGVNVVRVIAGTYAGTTGPARKDYALGRMDVLGARDERPRAREEGS